MGGDPFADAARVAEDGGGSGFFVGEPVREKGGEEGIAGADGVGDLDLVSRFPIPAVVVEKAGSAGAGGDADGGRGELGGEGAGVGFFATGVLGGAGGEAGGFGGVEFEECGAGGEGADERQVVVRRA